MPHRTALIVLASLATLFAGRAGAQSGGAGSRAEEEASRPLRLIIEAAKIKPKARPAEVPTSARPAAAPVARPAPAAAVPAPQSESAAVVAADPPSALPPGGPESSVATVEVQATPRSPEPLPLPAVVAEPQAQPEAAPPLPPLKLRTLVEPVTPRHLAGRLRGEVRVEVQLNVAADGSVSEATVMASSHPQMNAAVLDAVRQWRYEPAGRAREHAVQVVLRPDS
jgi:protein TonB